MPIGSGLRPRVADREAVSRRITQVLATLDCDPAVYHLGLRWRLDPEAEPHAAGRFRSAQEDLAPKGSLISMLVAAE
jgi:hypothetical protein